MKQALLWTHASLYTIPNVAILNLPQRKIKKMKIKEDLMEILNDHRSNVIEMIEEEKDPNLTQEIEAMYDRMINEVNELLGSSYE